MNVFDFKCKLTFKTLADLRQPVKSFHILIGANRLVNWAKCFAVCPILLFQFIYYGAPGEHDPLHSPPATCLWCDGEIGRGNKSGKSYWRDVSKWRSNKSKLYPKFRRIKMYVTDMSLCALQQNLLYVSTLKWTRINITESLIANLWVFCYPFRTSWSIC